MSAAAAAIVNRALSGLGAWTVYPSNESHPEVLPIAEANAAAKGIRLVCKEWTTWAPGGGYFNRACAAPDAGMADYIYGPAEVYTDPNSSAWDVLRENLAMLAASSQPANTQTQTPSTPPPTQPQAPSTPPPATYPVSLSLSPMRSQFTVGDAWSIVVTGAPLADVRVSARQNSADMGTTTLGKTDSAGRFTISGRFDASTIGTWAQSWSVGNQAAGALSFAVAPAAAPPTQPEQPQGTQQPAANQTAAGVLDKVWKSLSIGTPTTTTTTTPTGNTPANPFAGVPLWVYGLAAAAGLYLVTRRDY